MDGPTDLSVFSTTLQNHGYVTAYYGNYFISDPLGAATWLEHNRDGFRTFMSVNKVQLPTANRCHYTVENNIVTEYFGIVPTRVAFVRHKQGRCKYEPIAFDAAGNILGMVGLDGKYSNSGGTLARLQPVWLPYELGIIPTEPPVVTPYPDLPSDGTYIYSPDGTLYSIFNRFTRMYSKGSSAATP